ncbi:MAG TPA: hypothetical protein VKM54_04200 [Myxococcota bacterium]|nr:hypothetical protein [Myxococcota bacterium]
MGGIEVRNSHPVEENTEIPLHRRHEFACVLAEVESLAGLGRDDELPKARISCAFPPADAIGDIDLFLGGVEALAGTALLLGSFARQVTSMGPPVGAATIPDPPHNDDALLKQRRREADETRASERERSCSSPAPRELSRNLTQAARAWHPARVPKLSGTRSHLEVFHRGILHRSYSTDPRSGDLMTSVKVDLQQPLHGATPDRM